MALSYLVSLWPSFHHLFITLHSIIFALPCYPASVFVRVFLYLSNGFFAVWVFLGKEPCAYTRFFDAFMFYKSTGVVVQWLRIRTHNTGLVSSNPARVTFFAPLVRKGTGQHLIQSNA